MAISLNADILMRLQRACHHSACLPCLCVQLSLLVSAGRGLAWTEHGRLSVTQPGAHHRRHPAGAWHSPGMHRRQTLYEPALFALQALAGKSLADPEHAQPSVDWLRRNLEAVRTSSLPKDLETNDSGEPWSHPSKRGFAGTPSFVIITFISLPKDFSYNDEGGPSSQPSFCDGSSSCARMCAAVRTSSLTTHNLVLGRIRTTLNCTIVLQKQGVTVGYPELYAAHEQE